MYTILRHGTAKYWLTKSRQVRHQLGAPGNAAEFFRKKNYEKLRSERCFRDVLRRARKVMYGELATKVGKTL
jgi:hypothetical protein